MIMLVRVLKVRFLKMPFEILKAYIFLIQLKVPITVKKLSFKPVKPEYHKKKMKRNEAKCLVNLEIWRSRCVSINIKKRR